MGSVVVRTFAADEWRLYRTLRLAALEESPDAFGSTWEHESARADDDWAARLTRGVSSPRELPLVAEIDNETAGLAWVRLEEEGQDTAAHLYQMWVDPVRRGRGVGRALLEAAVTWARSVGAHAVVLGVTTGNMAAVQLYEAAGFVATGTEEPLRPGSALRSQSMRIALESRRRE